MNVLLQCLQEGDGALPTADAELRKKLLHYYVEMSTGPELSDWLRDLGQNPAGTVEEKSQRVLAHTAYLSMSADKFPEQTRQYLDRYSSQHLADICEELALSNDGTKDTLYRRIMREVGYRENWLKRYNTGTESALDLELVRPFINWYPITKRGQYERDFYQGFFEEMAEIFGEDSVHEQFAVAHGNSLKIDFHLGHPQEHGVGVEFKLPTSNSELQRGIGQLGQYKTRYGSSLILVLIPDFVDKAQQLLFIDACRDAGVSVLIK
jgi:hypothetical protein